jgi:hypothetical protein
MREVAGSTSPEGRRPSRIPEVTGSSSEDRSTSVFRLASPLRPSFAVIVAQDSQRPPRAPLPRIIHQLVTNPPRGAGSLAAGDLTLLVVTAVDSSGRLDLGTDALEVAQLFLGLLGAGSGVLLRGTSGSRMISLLLLMFLDVFVEMLYN